MAKNQKEKNSRNLALPHYFQSSPRNPIGRVAPCIDAMIAKLSVVRNCCDAVAIELRDTAPDTAIDGMSRILFEVENELFEATEVLRDEIHE